jgi:hypothetical protein
MLWNDSLLYLQKELRRKNAACSAIFASSVVLSPDGCFSNSTWVLLGYPHLPFSDSWRNGNGKAVTTPFLPAEFVIYEHYSSAM